MLKICVLDELHHFNTRKLLCPNITSYILKVVVELDVDPTLFVIPCKNIWGIIDLQCCNYYHLTSVFSFKFQSSMIILRHKFLTREGMVLANG